MTNKEKGKEPCGGTALDSIERYAAEKRLQLLLNNKFEMMEKLHPLLSGESKEIINGYMKVFDEMNAAIRQEIKFLSDF